MVILGFVSASSLIDMAATPGAKFAASFAANFHGYSF